MLSAPTPQVVAQNATKTGAEQVLEYYATLRGLSAADLQYERTQQEQAFAYSQSHIDRLRLVGVLSASDASAADITQALTLLRVYLQAQEARPEPLQALARLFWQMLQSQEQGLAYAALHKKLQQALIQQEEVLAEQQHMQQKLLAELGAQKALTGVVQKQLQEAMQEKERQSALQRQLRREIQDEKKNVRKLQKKIEQIQDIEKSLMERERPDNKGT